MHEEFKAQGLIELKKQYPGAAILVHPESPQPVVDLADFVGSTSQLIRAAKEMEQQAFIVATDQGIFYKMQQTCPNKQFYIAPTAGTGATCRSCASCPWMGMNTLESMLGVFAGGIDREIFVDADTAKKAMKPLQRMLDFQKA